MHLVHSVGQSLLPIIGLIVAIQIPFMLLTFIVALRERHSKAVYVPIDEAHAPRPNAYMEQTNAMVEQHGFQYLGACRAGNAKLYKMRYDSWLSPDRHVFAVVGAGKLAAIPYQAVWLTSKLIDGRVLITVDAPGAMAADLSGMTEWKVVSNADFPELLARHQARLDAEITPVEPYPDQNPLDAHVELIAQRAERMARLGYVYFLDDDPDVWRYTLWGAVVRVADSYRRAFVQIMRNYGRRNVSRPGDYGYIPSQKSRTRAWLRYVEIALWVAIVLATRIWSERRFVTPQQAVFRLLVLLGAFGGLAAIWLWRWRIGHGTVDPQKRRRRRYAIAGAACLVVGGIYMMRPYPQTVDTVTSCQILAGGGRVYVVVEGARLKIRTSHLIQLLRKLGRRGFPFVISSEPTLHILESDGETARSIPVATHDRFGEIMPMGQHLYMVDLLDDNAVMQWQDGAFVPAAEKDQDTIRKWLDEDLDEPIAAPGWDCTLLAGRQAERFSKSLPAGGRQVRVEVSLGPFDANMTRVLHAKMEVPGQRPLVQTFPSGR